MLRNCLDFVKQDLETQRRLQNRIRKKLNQLQQYGEYRIETDGADDLAHTYICRMGERRKLKIPSPDEKQNVILGIRAQRFLGEMLKRIDQNIRSMEILISKYRDLEPYEISKSIREPYLPVPQICLDFIYGNSNRSDCGGWITQPEINGLVFAVAGPGAETADAAQLADMLVRAGSEKLRALSERIGEKRLEKYLHPNHPENLKYRAKDGTLVRSKGEALLIDIFSELHIAYRYEEPVEAGGTEYDIDFVIRLPRTNRLVYLEHAGMLEKDSYRERISTRIGDLLKIGIIPGWNFFITCDLPGGRTDTPALREKILYILRTDR